MCAHGSHIRMSRHSARECTAWQTAGACVRTRCQHRVKIRVYDEFKQSVSEQVSGLCSPCEGYEAMPTPQLRVEVENHGFDKGFSSSRLFKYHF